MSDERIGAIGTLLAPRLRDSAGRHEYDGTVPDLSPDGVTAALARLGGPPLDDEHDEAHLAAFEAGVRVEYGEIGVHRRSPRPLLAALDLSGYDRPYAPAEERDAARREHLSAWPAAIEAGIESLDAVAAPVARGLLRSVAGAATGLDPTAPGATDALAAHARLVAHLERCAEHGDPDASLGADALTRSLCVPEAADVDLGAMEEAADTERDRLMELLEDAAARLAPRRPVAEVVADLLHDHPDVDGVLRTAETLTEEAIAFTRERGLLTDRGGECRVAASPPSRRWATAMMSWSAPYEPDGPSWYHISPPDDAWPAQRQQEWLSAFSYTTLPSTTVHEVARGTSRTAGPCALRGARSAAACTRPRSSRAGRTTRRSCWSRRATARRTRACASGSR